MRLLLVSACTSHNASIAHFGRERPAHPVQPRADGSGSADGREDSEANGEAVEVLRLEVGSLTLAALSCVQREGSWYWVLEAVVPDAGVCYNLY